MTSIKIKNYKIQNFSSPFLIAEIGINHNGSMSLAEEMICAAKESGADAVKFQFFQKDKLINPYIKEGNEISRILNTYTLTPDQIADLKAFSEKQNILFLVTPFDTEGIRLLQKMKQSFYKIASGDINNFLLLEAAAKTKKPLIISTGASAVKEITQAVSYVSQWNSKIILLHCVSLYPAEDSVINLWSIPYLQQKFSVPVGLSDHTKGIKAMEYASVLGAAVIEKHFTLSKRLKGPDHKLSATPEELKKFRQKLQSVQTMTGTLTKIPGKKELEGNYWGRRSLVASRDIKRNELINEKNILALRPNKGLPASYYIHLKNKKAKKNIQKGSFIKHKDFE